MSTHLFAYGTLCAPEIFRAVVGRNASSEPALLEGYRCRLLRGKIYPGIIPQAEEVVKGVLYRDLSAEEWRRLDEFEDDLYVRARVQVQGGTDATVAEVYLVRDHASDALSDERWDLELFREQHLERMLARLSEA